MPEFPAAQPHGPIQTVNTRMKWVQGSMKIGLMKFSRNMVILTHGSDITLINPIRLSAKAEVALNAIGTVKNVIRLGAFHGLDDGYYRHKYTAKIWGAAGEEHPKGTEIDVEYYEDTPLPFPDAKLFVFQGKHPEGAIVVGPAPGFLITCDSIQHHPNFKGTAPFAKVMMTLMGFRKPATIGLPWLKRMASDGADMHAEYQRLLRHEFDGMLGGHGQIMERGAKAAVQKTLDRVF